MQTEGRRFELSHPQMRIWNVEQLNGATSINNIVGIARYKSKVDLATLEKALNLFVEREDMLRMRIELYEDRPVQSIQPYAYETYSVIDFSSRINPEYEFETWTNNEAMKPFEVVGERLYRIVMFKINDQEYGYFINAHHIISDGWSLQLMGNFINRTYQELTAGTNTVTESETSYVDFYMVEKNYLESNRAKDDKEFWLKEFATVPDNVMNPLNYSSSGRSEEMNIESDLACQIRAFASDKGMNVSSFFMLCYYIVFQKIEKRKEIVFGTPIYNRSGKHKNTFGMYTSTIPVKMEIKDNLSFLDMAKEFGKKFYSCLRHQKYPYDCMIKDLKEKQDNDISGLFNFCFNYYTRQLYSAGKLGEIDVNFCQIYSGKQTYPLYAVLDEWNNDDSIHFTYTYLTSIYSKEYVQNLHICMLELIQQVLENPNKKIRQFTFENLVQGIHQTNISIQGLKEETINHFPYLQSNVNVRNVEMVSIPMSMGQKYYKKEAYSLSLMYLLEHYYNPEPSSKLVIQHNQEETSYIALSWDSEMEWKELYELICDMIYDEGSDIVYNMLSAQSGGMSQMDNVVTFEEVDKKYIEEETSVNLIFYFAGDHMEAYFNTSVYEETYVKYLCSQLFYLGEQLKINEARTCCDFEVITEEQRAQILEQFNDTACPYPDNRTLLDFFEENCKKRPEHVAIKGANYCLTYAELDKKSNQFARVIQKNVQSRNVIIPVILRRSAEMMIAIYGVIKAGHAYLPIDPDYPESRIKYILEDCNTTLVVGNVKFENTIKSITINDELLENESSEKVEADIQVNDVAYVIYTSGSTGKPKGVMIEHTSAVNRLVWMQKSYSLDETDVLLQKTPISFDVSVWELFWWGMFGASLFLLEPGDEKNPDQIIQAIKENQVTTMHFVPSMLNAFLNFCDQAGVNLDDLNSLKRVFASGEALQASHVDLFNKVFKNKKAKLINLYGPTEATVDVTYFNCEKDRKYAKIPIGKPIDNTNIFMLDENLKLCPIGVPGELHIAGVQLARGYYNKEELTNERFIKNPYGEGRLYKTGDLARWMPDGNIEYLDRTDNQVKIRGFRIELEEIEKALCNHQAVKSAVVTAIQGATGNEKLLCAYVIKQEECSVEELQGHIGKVLPEYMVPTVILFLNSFPLSPNGKLDRKALPVPDLSKRNSEYVKPETEDEKNLAAIWEEVLKIENIGVEDNFFSLGGDSIKFITVLTKAKSKHLNFTFKQLFEFPTIRGLLNEIEGKQNDTIEKERVPFELLTQTDREKMDDSIEDAYPLSFLQDGLIYQSELNKGSSVYHDVFNYTMHGKFDADKFREAIEIVTNKHEIIRTTYHLQGYEQHIQKVHKKIPTPLVIYDLRDKDAETKKEILDRNLKRIRNEIFNWEEPGLISVYIHVLKEEEYVYTLSFHDSALDGWSVNLLHTDIFTTYYNLLNGQEVDKLTSTVRFRDFIQLENEAIKAGVDKQYWKEKLSQFEYTHIQPWEKTDKDVPVEIQYLEVNLPDGLSDTIRNVAAQAGVPVKTVLLAAHICVLSRLSGNGDVVSGYEYSGRPEEVNGETILGLFLNTLPFRVECEDDTWLELIQKVYKTEMELIPHRRYPMMNIKNDQENQNPLFEAVFNFTHFHVLKKLQEISGLSFLDVRLLAETEFTFRAEFSQHPFTDDVLFWIHYHSNVFSLKQIQYIASYYVNVLQSICQDLNLKMNEQEIISKSEMDKQINTFNSNKEYAPIYTPYHKLFEEQVLKSESEIAVRFEDQAFTYGELNKRANRVAGFLMENGLKYQEIVSVLMDRNIDWITCILANLKLGTVYLPMDMQYPDTRIREILDKSKCKVILVSDEAKKKELQSKLEEYNVSIYVVSEILASYQKEENLERMAEINELTYIIFTSGSTGKPKGVMIESCGMINHLYAKIHDLHLKKEDIIAQTASQCFDISVWQVLSGLLVGSSIVVYSNEKILQVNEFVKTINEDQVTIWETVPSYLTVIVHYAKEYDITFPKLRIMLVTGEAVKKQGVDEWFSRFPQIPLVNAYGPTEASDDITHFIMNEAPGSDIVPVGKTLQNLKIYILDKNRRIVPLGSKGEVCVAGIGVGRGYINDKEKTEEVFIENPYSEASYTKMYRTGDVGRWLPNGILELYGRVDNQVKVHGFRIELDEIESRMQQVEEIEDAAVIIDERNNDKKLVAFVICDDDVEMDFIRFKLKDLLPEYMIPNIIIRYKKFPLTPNGKVDKKKLMEIAAEIKQEETTVTELKTEDEKYLAAIWSQVLSIEEAAIYQESNFFDLGGHSLKAMELSLKVDNAITINDVFKYPTIAEMAMCLEQNRSKDKKNEVLIDFTQGNSKKELALVCFTYAGGNAVNFKPLFDALYTLTDKIECYSIEFPADEFDLNNSDEYFNKAVQKCYNEIVETTSLPIYLWGHCSGNAMMLEVARLLEENHKNLQHVFIGAKLIHDNTTMKLRNAAINLLSPFSAVDVKKMTHEQIKKWLIEKTEFTDFEQLGEKESKVITDAFRRDAYCANTYLKRIYQTFKNQKLRTKVTNVVSDTDPLTQAYEKRSANWKKIADNYELQVIEGGGHYFNKTKANETAALIQKYFLADKDNDVEDSLQNLYL